MLATLIAIAAMFTFILGTHNYILKRIYRDALDEPKPYHKPAK